MGHKSNLLFHAYFNKADSKVFDDISSDEEKENVNHKMASNSSLKEQETSMNNDDIVNPEEDKLSN